MTAVPEPSLRERKKQQTRTAIADAAAQLFAARGFDRVTVDEVARAAGVAKQTVFNYFPAKEDLVFDRAAEVQALMVAAVRDRAPETTLVEAFRALTHGFWQQIAALSDGRPQAGFFDIVERTPALQAHMRELGERIVEELTAVIAAQAGAAADDLRPRLVAGALAMIHHRVVEAARPRIAGGERARDFVDELLARADEAYDLLAAGIGTYAERGPTTPAG
jgi:AcrR family transcriptional regulator